jgi:GTPase SAR1 family protein
MSSELELLAATAREFAIAIVGRPEAERALRVAERLEAGRFLVSVVGEFKRGKSTLINALVGDEVLPTGVLPLTAVATELVFGEPGAFVVHLDGTILAIEPPDVVEYVTEDRNPHNEREVARVEIRGHWPLLEPGVVLVDTPGVGSIHIHNTEAARAALLDSDGTVLVLSADAPFSEQERDLARTLAERSAPTFFVLNKADHLSGVELDDVRRFVEQALYDELGRKVRVFALSARSALRVGATADDAGEFDAFVAELERFIAEDLVAARLTTARRELARLGAAVRDGLALEQAAAALDAETLARHVELFRGEAFRQRAAFEDDRTILDRDVARLAEELSARLAGIAQAEPAQHEQELAEVAAGAPRARLIDCLRSTIEASVRESFESFRLAEADRTEQIWHRLARAFETHTQQRLDAVRLAAADLFRIPLPQMKIAAVADEPEHFFYLFLHVGSFNEPFGRLLGRLVPARIARPRALAIARRELAREFDKHAGRARWDLTQRLDSVRRRFELAMAAELDDVTDAILTAAGRAEERRGAAAAERDHHAEDVQRQTALATALAELNGPDE